MKIFEQYIELLETYGLNELLKKSDFIEKTIKFSILINALFLFLVIFPLGKLMFMGYFIATCVTAFLLGNYKNSPLVRERKHLKTIVKNFLQKSVNQKITVSFFIEAKNKIASSIEGGHNSEQIKHLNDNISYFEKFIQKLSNKEIDDECASLFILFHNYVMKDRNKNIFISIINEEKKQKYIREILCEPIDEYNPSNFQEIEIGSTRKREKYKI